MQLAEQINKQWAPVLDHPDLPEIKDSHRRAVTALRQESLITGRSPCSRTGAHFLLICSESCIFKTPVMFKNFVITY